MDTVQIVRSAGILSAALESSNLTSSGAKVSRVQGFKCFNKVLFKCVIQLSLFFSLGPLTTQPLVPLLFIPA